MAPGVTCDGTGEPAGEPMKSDLTHLPPRKRRDIAESVKRIRAAADVEMIILFGSHARGDWVEDRYVEGGVTYEYRSDYDLLVILDLTRECGRGTKWHALEEQIRNHPDVHDAVTLVVEDIQTFNRRLTEGHYFYTDIRREGLVVYDSGRHHLAEARPLQARERARLARQHFRHWFPLGGNSLALAEVAMERGMLRDAAFLLHQATERLYFAVILTMTDYKPKTHDIEILRRKVCGLDPRFLTVLAAEDRRGREAFRRLKRAYIDARYDQGYRITRRQLEWLLTEIRRLKDLTEQACRQHIKALLDAD